MKKNLLLGLFILSTSFSSALLAADMKVGVVNFQEVVQKSPDYEAFKTKLEKEFAPKQKKLLEAQKELQKDVEEYRKNESILTEDKKKAAQEKFIKKQQQIQADEMAFQKEYALAQEKAFYEIVKKIKGASAAKVAKEANVDLILSKDAVIHTSGPDLTEKMISALK